MNVKRIDLNLLVYLNTLLKERSVSRAAEKLGITQPAMSNALRRLRDLLGDPILVRTSSGMTPTERAKKMEPLVVEALSRAELALQPVDQFDPSTSVRTFRIMASDYIESTLLAPLLGRLNQLAPNVTLDVLTPSDASFSDLERGDIDMAINRFDHLPDSFHQKSIWRDNFACLMGTNHSSLDSLTLDAYLESQHIWVSKTGIGVGTGMSPKHSQKLGWVDEALADIEKKRKITLFTRNYQVSNYLLNSKELIATLPMRAALLWRNTPGIHIAKPPFPIVPIEIKMAWSPVLHHNIAHKWLREEIKTLAASVKGNL
tara:strand:- start:180 stop:1127 length:948 start_codon:yes stop_codon:yes gene_type:complete